MAEPVEGAEQLSSLNHEADVILQRLMHRYNNFFASVLNGGVKSSHDPLRQMHEMRQRKDPNAPKSADLLKVEKFNRDLQTLMQEKGVTEELQEKIKTIRRKIYPVETEEVTQEDLETLRDFEVIVGALLDSMLSNNDENGEPVYSEKYLIQ